MKIKQMSHRRHLGMCFYDLREIKYPHENKIRYKFEWKI